MKASNLSVNTLALTALTACGGGGSGTDATNKPAPLESHNENLSVASGELNTSIPAGIWLGNFRFTQEITKNDYSSSITEMGRSLFIITLAQNSPAFEVWLCSNIYNSYGNTAFSLNNNILTHQSQRNIAENEATANYFLNQTLTVENNLNAVLIGTMEHHNENNHDKISFRMAAKRISSAVTFTEAASEYNIRFTATSSNKIDFSDISNDMKCVFASREQINNTIDSKNTHEIMTNVSVQSVNEKITLSEHIIQNGEMESNGLFQFTTPNESRSGGCDAEHCETLTNISVDITEDNDEKIAFAASASGDSDLPDVSASFSISAK